MSGRFEIVNRAVNSPIEFQYEQKNRVTEYLEHNQLSYASSCPTVHKKLPRFTYIYIYIYIVFFFLLRFGPTRAMASSFLRFLDHTQRRITVGRTSLDE